MFILLTHLSYSLDKVPSQVFFFFFFFLQWANLIGSSLRKMKYGGSPKWKVLFSGTEFLPFGPPIQVEGGQHLQKHKGKEWCAIGNSCFDLPKTGPKKKQKLAWKVDSPMSKSKKVNSPHTVYTQSTPKTTWNKNLPQPTRKKGWPLHSFFLLSFNLTSIPGPERSIWRQLHLTTLHKAASLAAWNFIRNFI